MWQCRSAFVTVVLLVASCAHAPPDLRVSPEVAVAPPIEEPHVPSPEPELAPTECPDGMVLAEGDYCPNLVQRCLRWMDPPGRYHQYRCAEYEKPAKCRGAKVHKRFCIDRYERTAEGSALPRNDMSWLDTKRFCEADGARVCLESEWNFACEGEDMRPYPYGWARDAALCNADHLDLTVPGDGRKLIDLRTPEGAHPQCTSPFGIQEMAGNVAEWVTVDGTAAGSVVVQKGNWWQPGKHACRDAQGGHDKFYHGTETGFRCCQDPRESISQPTDVR